MDVICPKCKSIVEVDGSLLYDEFVYNMETCEHCKTTFVCNESGGVFFVHAHEPISVTVDVVLMNSEKDVLLVTRKHPPHIGALALPGGFVNSFETCEDAAVREVFEETHLWMRKSDLKPIKVLSRPDRDARGRVISCVFLYDGYIDREPRAGDDAQHAAFYDPYRVKNMAFDHKVVLDYLKLTGVM